MNKKAAKSKKKAQNQKSKRGEPDLSLGGGWGGGITLLDEEILYVLY